MPFREGFFVIFLIEISINRRIYDDSGKGQNHGIYSLLEIPNRELHYRRDLRSAHGGGN